MDRLINANPVGRRINPFTSQNFFTLVDTTGVELVDRDERGVLLPAFDFDSSRWDILTAPWLYSSIENNEFLDNVNGSMENREFFEDVEDILRRVKHKKFEEQ